MSHHALAVVIAVVLVAITIALAVYASRQLGDTGDHYVAGGRLKGWQNGIALAGDQISAGSFLGITGAVALTGFSGFYLAAGLPAAYLLILLLIAEPLRNLGRYTLADAVCARFEGRALRGAVAVATLIISIVYMVIQFVGAGLVSQLLFGIDYWIVVIFLGVITTLYTVLGGMIATTYIQIFKASVLIVIVAVLTLITISRTGWNPVGPLLHARSALGNKAIVPLHMGTTSSLENISLSLGLVLGFMGLPHVVLRFMTVRDGRAARDSTRLAMWIFAVFFLILIILGYAAINEVGPAALLKANKAGNLAAPQLAQAVGGQVLFALVSGVLIATVLAVLASLAIASSGAVAHDLYTQVIKRGDVTPARQLRISRVSGGVVAAIAVLIALAAKDKNVAFLSNVAFAIAASSTTPVLLLTLYWPSFNRAGATAAMIGGLIVSCGLVIVGPDVLGGSHLFGLSIPALVSVPAALIFAYVGTLLGRGDPRYAGTPYPEIRRTAFPPRRARPSVGAPSGAAARSARSEGAARAV
jgi:SSS family solute:Na+ symporter/cation/acetate symporter